jgi:hypothetical protein
LGGLLYGALAGLFVALVDCVGSKALSFLLNCVLIAFCAIIITGMTCSWIDSDSWICSDSENYPFEFALNLPAAEKGDAVAQLNIGLMYYKGQGVEQDYAEAVKWWRKAAEQGCAGAQYNLGVTYDKGQGVGRDSMEAVKWWRKAAEQGHVDAQNILESIGEIQEK